MLNEEILARVRWAAAEACDEDILHDFGELGYTLPTVQLLFLVPAVQMAWVDGWVTHAERKVVLDVAQSRGLEKGSAPHRKLCEWLCDCPSAHFFEVALVVIAQTISGLPPGEASAQMDSVVSLSARVAYASSLMGFRESGTKVTNAERELLVHIVKQLDDRSSTSKITWPPSR